MPMTRRAVALSLCALPLAACGNGMVSRSRVDEVRPVAAGSPELRAMIDSAADRHDVPRDLVHRVVMRESRYNPAARNGPYMGLMQIHPQTARGMGYTGPADGLLDPAVNLEYAVRYLRGAWLVSRGDKDAAVRWYARGYYYEAKRLGLLEETGLRT
jgi:soluble lytic murein transglycosylase-like protein